MVLPRYASEKWVVISHPMVYRSVLIAQNLCSAPPFGYAHPSDMGHDKCRPLLSRSPSDMGRDIRRDMGREYAPLMIYRFVCFERVNLCSAPLLRSRSLHHMGRDICRTLLCFPPPRHVSWFRTSHGLSLRSGRSFSHAHPLAMYGS